MKRHALTLWLAGTAIALTACGNEDPEPEFTADPSASASPTASASPVAEKETPEEFIRRWNDIDQRMQTTGDTAEYASVSSDCAACMQTAHLVESYYKAGGYIDWDGREITRIEHIGGNTYDVSFKIAPTRYQEAAGERVKRHAGGQGKMRFVLVDKPIGITVKNLTLRPVA